MTHFSRVFESKKIDVLQKLRVVSMNMYRYTKVLKVHTSNQQPLLLLITLRVAYHTPAQIGCPDVTDSRLRGEAP
jgi:hypothetical protein